MKHFFLQALLIIIFQLSLFSFEAIKEEEKGLYRFNLEKNFYKTDEDFKKDVERVKDIVSKIEAHRNRVGESKDELLELMNLISQYTDLYYKLYAYGEFREAINTKDRYAYETFLEITSNANSRISFVKVELLKIEEERLKKYFEENKELEKYRYFINDIRRNRDFTLSREKEEILSKLAPTRFEWQSALFQLAFDRTPFETIEVDGKNYSVYLDYEELMRNRNREIREKTFKSYFKTLDSIKDICSFALLNLEKALNEEATLRGFKTYYDQTLYESYLSREEIENIFLQLKQNSSLYKEYQKFKLENVAKKEKIEKPEIWDYEIPPSDLKELKFHIKDGLDTIIKALSPLGDKYLTELKALLDPKNGRIDIVGGPNRRQGAFCEAGYGFFQDNYSGSLEDLSTIAHEAGHAIHHRLVLLNRGGELFSQGPPYLTESFSMFNEYLLRDYLLKNLKDEKERKTIIYDWLNEEMYIFELARRAEFEMRAYDEVKEGTLKLEEDGFSKICYEVGKEYDMFFEKYPELKLLWLRKHHYWTVPAYYKNYVVAQILAMKYFEAYKKEGEAFSKKYVAMVENGLDREPEKLLYDFLKIDLKDKNLLRDVLEIVKKHFEDYKKM